MIDFEKFELENGLRVIVHQDKSTPLACVNIVYDVGSRDEDPDKTGFAHLFEHLMFGGSKNIPQFDEPLQMVGGENNAFTSHDITNYHLTLPAQNLETAFWLESDRMLNLAFSQKSLDVQKNVVIEEFKQRYLNQPYGDVWLLMRPMAYKVHPYLWDTIGKNTEHIENATMQDVKAFFKKFYVPNNAVMVVAGNVHTDDVKRLSQKWFASIPRGENYTRALPFEPQQQQARELIVERDVAANAIYKAFHMCARRDDRYYATDLMSDILSNGNSARLHKSLIKEKQLFSSVQAYASGDFDAGLFIISGKLNEGVSMEQANQAIEEELSQLQKECVTEEELIKVKNKVEASHTFGEVDILNKATNLAIAELLSGANMINQEIARYHAVSSEDIRRVATELFDNKNSNTLYYRRKE